MNFQTNKLLFIIIFLVSVVTARAQILNDSTKNVYGPRTTRYFLEEDLLNSIDTAYTIDTILTGFHRYNFTQRYNNQYQDLGNRGTAIQPLFYKPPQNIGFRSGFNAYDLYFDELVDMRFYNTKSPYSKFHYIQGGRGTSFLETEFSRNINPNWNFGVAFNRVSANPQIDFQQRAPTPEVDHISYSAYTAYRAPDKRYAIDAYVRRMYHKVHETGGVLVDSTITSFFNEKKFNTAGFLSDYSLHAKNLLKALSGDLRVNFHIYQQFKFSELIGVYHVFDFQRQTMTFEDEAGTTNSTFYINNFIDEKLTQRETTIFKVYRNDFGLKGELDKFKYRLYYRRRNIFVDNFRLNDTGWEIEDVAGGEVAVRFSETALLHFNGELLANSTITKSNDFQVNFSFENRYLKASYKRILHAPSYLQQEFFGNHDSWKNDFSPIMADDISFSPIIPFERLQIIPRVKASRISNYTYFNEKIEPQQADQVLLISPGLDLNFNLGNFYFKNSITYNQQDKKGKEVMRLPLTMANVLIYFQQPITKKGHFLQVGVDANWKSSYYADKYMPSIQQFYLQNELNIQKYVLVDVFASMKINRTRVFAKVSHANQLAQSLGGMNGYLVRPYYFGFRRTLDVGVSWMFFD